MAGVALFVGTMGQQANAQLQFRSDIRIEVELDGDLSFAAGDIDNDGDLDFAVSGTGNSLNITKVFNNEMIQRSISVLSDNGTDSSA